MENRKYPQGLVFGLDIGTRSIVGTVGYKTGESFFIVAQEIREHETRAMLDGQIHDIRKVGGTILTVKEALEEKLGRTLTDVCIAAAGRVLRTVTVHVAQTFEKEQEVTEEDIYALASLGIENAYQEFVDANDTDMKFYCVGYSVIRYFLNGYPMGNLEGHKAKEIACDLIATFLPDDVVDGLYKAVGFAGLEVANLTLEPIAAIQVAIPEMYRMLNIALVDVGAGTSDISITKDGSIIAYGMIPIAGDALTEVIAQNCLVDFATAETIKRGCGEAQQVEYRDIMGLSQTITRAEIEEITRPVLENMTRQVSDKIKELNGGKAVSAVFVVGGGGRLAGYTEHLAAQLGIQKERVAVRGEEVMQKIRFQAQDARRDSLMVTPIGICLSFYEQSNNFIFVNFNKRRIKIYDNNRLAVVDAAIQAEFPNEGLFPRRGKELNFIVNGQPRILRGALGEASVILVNGTEADIHTPIHANDVIEVRESTAGEPAKLEIQALPEYQASLNITINGKKVELPKFARVNGELQSGYYDVQDGDVIEILSFYTVEQIAEFMDLPIRSDMPFYVNNARASLSTEVYENFSVIWAVGEAPVSDVERDRREGIYRTGSAAADAEDGGMADSYEELAEENIPIGNIFGEDYSDGNISREDVPEEDASDSRPKGVPYTMTITVVANGKPVTLSGKSSYVYVDIFDVIDFDLSKPRGAGIVTKLNGRDAQYMERLSDGDKIDIYWRGL